jgi:hypothetical protein
VNNTKKYLTPPEVRALLPKIIMHDLGTIFSVLCLGGWTVRYMELTMDQNGVYVSFQRLGDVINVDIHEFQDAPFVQAWLHDKETGTIQSLHKWCYTMGGVLERLSS